MNFRAEYSEQQQAFRSVVRTWMEHHAPRGLDVPGDGSPIAPDAQERIKDFRKIATRYDRLAQNFLAAVYLGSTICYWL